MTPRMRLALSLPVRSYSVADWSPTWIASPIFCSSSAVAAGKPTCPRQRFTLAVLPPAMPGNGTTVTSASAPPWPGTLNEAMLISPGAALVQPAGNVHCNCGCAGLFPLWSGAVGAVALGGGDAEEESSLERR